MRRDKIDRSKRQVRWIGTAGSKTRRVLDLGKYREYRRAMEQGRPDPEPTPSRGGVA